MSLYLDVNRLASSYHVVEDRQPGGRTLRPPLLLRDDPAALQGWRMSHDAAQRLSDDGLAPDYLAELAAAAGLETKDLYEFTGIDRTTVGRRKAAGQALPHDVAVKALVATELLTQANQVFGAAAPAARWLTTPHPLLDDQTPLQRARTPWGLAKVQAMLVALRFGGAA